MILDQGRPIDALLELPASRRAVVVVFVLLLPAALIVWFALRPRWLALDEGRRQRAVARDELATGQLRVAGYGELARQAAARARFIARFDSWMPAAEGMPQLLGAAALAARKAGAVDLSLSREAAGPAGSSPAGVKEWPVRVEARADLRGVAAFVDELLSSPRYLRLEELRVGPAPANRLARPPGGQLAGLALRLTAFSRIDGGS